LIYLALKQSHHEPHPPPHIMTIKSLSDRLDKLTSAKPTIKLTGFVMHPDGYIWPIDAIQRGDFWIVPNDAKSANAPDICNE